MGSGGRGEQSGVAEVNGLHVEVAGRIAGRSGRVAGKRRGGQPRPWEEARRA